MKHRERLSVVLFVFALGCGDRSALDVFAPATGLSEAGASGSGSSGGGETSSSSSGSGSSRGGGSSGSSGSSGGSSSGGGGINLTCTGGTSCVNGQICCATVNMSAGFSVTSACQAGLCAPGAYQFCASTVECFGGTTCEPNPLGQGPMICTAGGDSSSGGVSPSCSAQTCKGCCDANALCQAGTELTACGSGGESCNMCGSSQVCSGGGCAAPSGSSSSGGGMCFAASCPACVAGTPACCPMTGACGCQQFGDLCF